MGAKTKSVKSVDIVLTRWPATQDPRLYINRDTCISRCIYPMPSAQEQQEHRHPARVKGQGGAARCFSRKDGFELGSETPLFFLPGLIFWLRWH